MLGRFQYQFQKNNSLEKRLEMSHKIQKIHPDRVPVIVERANGSKLPVLTKNKYLVPRDLSMGGFLLEIRKQMQLRPEQAVFLFIKKGILPSSCNSIGSIYNVYQNRDDEILYIQIKEESVFGSREV